MNLVMSDDLKKRLLASEYAIEANSYESHMLWHENHKRYKWEQDNGGYGFEVGKLDGRGVFLSLFWNNIGGKNLLFWYPTSQVVDHLMINEWFKEVCPQLFTESRNKMGDANNFHIACDGMERLDE